MIWPINVFGDSIATFDIEKTYNGKKALEYYGAYLAMFGGLNCLLDDYHDEKDGKSLKRFTETVFQPAFERVNTVLGIKPLIYRIQYEDDFNLFIRNSKRYVELFEEYKRKIENEN